MIFYGWYEQNEVCWGIETIEVDNPMFLPPNECVKVEGLWFESFSEAKQECIKLWSFQHDLAKRALSEIRKQQLTTKQTGEEK